MKRVEHHEHKHRLVTVKEPADYPEYELLLGEDESLLLILQRAHDWMWQHRRMHWFTTTWNQHYIAIYDSDKLGSTPILYIKFSLSAIREVFGERHVCP